MAPLCDCGRHITGQPHDESASHRGSRITRVSRAPEGARDFRVTRVLDYALCRPILTRQRRGRLRAPPHSDILTWCHHVAGVRRGASGMMGGAGAGKTTRRRLMVTLMASPVNGGQAECLSGGREHRNSDPAREAIADDDDFGTLAPTSRRGVRRAAIRERVKVYGRSLRCMPAQAAVREQGESLKSAHQPPVQGEYAAPSCHAQRQGAKREYLHALPAQYGEGSQGLARPNSDLQSHPRFAAWSPAWKRVTTPR